MQSVTIDASVIFQRLCNTRRLLKSRANRQLEFYEIMVAFDNLGINVSDYCLACDATIMMTIDESKQKQYIFHKTGMWSRCFRDSYFILQSCEWMKEQPQKPNENRNLLWELNEIQSLIRIPSDPFEYELCLLRTKAASVESLESSAERQQILGRRTEIQCANGA